MTPHLPELLKKFFHKKKKKRTTADLEKVFVQCPSCKVTLYRKNVDDNQGICTECDFHFRLTNEKWLPLICDDSSFEILFDNIIPQDPLNFPSYTQKIEKLYSNGINEGILTAKTEVDGISYLLGIMDPDFMMGSMGSVVGERITLLFEKGIKENLPVFLIARSGGARMQEGVLSLMQMAKTSAAIKRYSDSGNFFAILLSYPTTGGVSASFAMLADVIMGEPGALIGFAGPRVIEQTIRQKLPEGFQSSEFLMEKGFLDSIVHRKEIRETLVKLFRIHAKENQYEY